MSIITLGDLKTIWEKIRDRAYDSNNDMLKVQSIQKKFRDSFGGSSLDTTKWDSVIGSGASFNISGGNITLNSGATINAETYLLSKDTFTVPFKLSFALGLSQRIANQTFYVEVVSVNASTGVPDGKHSAGFVFDGTTATTAKYRVQNSSSAAVDTSNNFPTTAGSVSYFEIEPFGDECWFHGGTIDSTTGRTNSYRKHKDIPDPNAFYKIRVRWLNGSTAPATSTAATLAYVACQDYAELTAEITAGRGQTAAGQAIGVSVLSVPTTPVSGTINNTPTTTTLHTLTAAASTNATSVKASSGNVYSMVITNYSASTKYLKLYNKASAPTIGTDIPIMTIPINATSAVTFDFAQGFRFSTGIAYAITGAIADADTTVLVAGDVKTAITYI